MKKYIYTIIAVSALVAACSKWTETESMADDFENAALKDLREKRDNAKFEAEAQRTEENRKALDAYWAQLREYKKKAWLNTGEAGGQTPFFYFWYSGGFWTTQKGIAKTWLQSIPDSITAISIWGGLGTRPENISESQKKDLDIFHQKGSKVLMCWQTPSVGLGLPNRKDGSLNGYDDFRKKYPFAEAYAQWPEIYARELARYIISLNFDGYDLDWETCGDHNKNLTKEGTPLMLSDDNYGNIRRFVQEMAKYFGPVGADKAVKTQAEREANLKALFDASTAGFHPKEKEYIDEFKPYLPADYLTKEYFFCCDVPCGVAPIFLTGTMEKYFHKHFLQNYDSDSYTPSSGWATPVMADLGGRYYNSAGTNFQAGGYGHQLKKAEVVKQKQVWGLAAYHGQTDYEINNENNEQFKAYLKEKNIKRKYLHYAVTREAMRIADPRPNYAGYVEKEPYIIIP